MLVAYDVADDRRRAGVFKALMDSGDHVQYSVFVCELNARELEELKGRLGETVNRREDQVLVLDMGLAGRDPRNVLQCIGKPYDPPVRALVV